MSILCLLQYLFDPAVSVAYDLAGSVNKIIYSFDYFNIKSIPGHKQ